MERRSRMLFSSSTMRTRALAMTEPMLHRAVCGRKRQEEGRSDPGLAPDLDLTVVVLHDAVDEGEPDAAALLLGGEERLEDLGQVALDDAVPRIADPQLHSCRVAPGQEPAAHPQLAALRHGLYGIDAEIPDGLAKLLGVHARGQRVAELAHHLELCRMGSVLDEHQNLLEELGEIHGVGSHGGGSRILEEVADNVIEPIG